MFLIKMLTGFAAKPALWFSLMSLPVLFLGTICLMGLLLPGSSGVVIPSLTFLFFTLAGHFIVMGFLGEMVLNAGDFRPARMIAGITIKEKMDMKT